MNSKGTLAVLATFVLVLSTVGATGVAAQTQDNQFRTTVTTVSVTEEGDAVWTIEYRVRLENESQVEDFKSFQEQFNSSQKASQMQDRMGAVVAEASNATNREMQILGVTANTSIENVPVQYGVVKYTIEWENFAKVEGDTIMMGDVFPDGLYLSDGYLFKVEAPNGYDIQSASPEPRSQNADSVTWVGPSQFGSDSPSVSFAPEGATQTQTTPSDRSDDDEFPVLPLVGGLLALLVVGTLAYNKFVAGDDDDGGNPGNSSGSTVTSNEDLSTPEERVIQLLKDNEGRIKQKTVTEHFGWSDSRTSQVLSSMEEEGKIERLRIGRENVVELTEDEDEE